MKIILRYGIVLLDTFSKYIKIKWQCRGSRKKSIITRFCFLTCLSFDSWTKREEEIIFFRCLLRLNTHSKWINLCGVKRKVNKLDWERKTKAIRRRKSWRWRGRGKTWHWQGTIFGCSLHLQNVMKIMLFTI